MRDIPFDTITFAHLSALKEDGISEDRHLDFKLELPGFRDDDKKEFLADICSFANAGGGDVIYGIEEAKDSAGKNTGTIATLRGLPGLNFDEVGRRLESLIRDGLDPRIQNVRIRAVDGGIEGPFLVIRIGRSFVGPHLVKFQNVARFYARHNTGKFQLDVREIRAAFLESDQGRQRARNFRLDRIAKIIANETPVRTQGARWLLHIVPVRATWSADIDLSSNLPDLSHFGPVSSGFDFSRRPNLDGLVAVAESRSAVAPGIYSLLFREGAIEAVDSWLLAARGETKLIPSRRIEALAFEYVKKYVAILRKLGVDAPLAISMSLIGVFGYRMGVSDDQSIFGLDLGPGFDRGEVLLPEIIMDTESITPESLRPMFDVLWQAAGWQRSLNFADDGSWKPG